MQKRMPSRLGFECLTYPDTEVTTEDRRTRLDGSESTYPALTIGAVTETLDTVPDSTTNGLEGDKSQMKCPRNVVVLDE